MTYTCVHNAEHVRVEEIAIDANAHEWDAGVVTKPATCVETGEMTYTCAHNAEHVRVEEIAIDENAHSYNEGRIDPNTISGGMGTKTYICTSCGHSKTEQVPAVIAEPSCAGSLGVTHSILVLLMAFASFVVYKKKNK